MNQKARKKIIKMHNNSQEKLFSSLTTVFSVLLIALGLITLVVVQKPIQESQDLRKDAMVEDGTVQLSYSADNDIKVGQQTTVTFAVDTQGAQIDGVQLVFTVQGAIDNLTAQTIAAAGLNEEFLEVEKQDNSNWLVGVLDAKPSGSFSSTSPVSFFQISFTPTSAGEVKILLNKSSSKANITGSYPVDDQLRSMADINLTINQEQTTDNTDQGEETADTTDTTDNNDQITTDDLYFTNSTNITFYNTDGDQIQPETLSTGENFKVKINYYLQNLIKNSLSDSQPIVVTYYFNGTGIASQTFSYSSLKNNENGFGGTFTIDSSGSTRDEMTHQLKVDAANSINESNEDNNLWTKNITIVGDNLGSGDSDAKDCNETCDAHTDCDINMGCYNIDGVKRCRLATNITSASCSQPEDEGLNRSCNEYCADSNECSDQYFCYYNRCRLPENASSESCVVPSQSVLNQIQENCNDACTSNNDCSANMRCYNSVCRLASNPSSTSCSPFSRKTVSNYTPKGGTTSQQQDLTDDQVVSTTDATSSATISAIVKVSPTPTTKPKASPLPTIAPEAEDQSALDAVITNLQQRGINFPLMMIGSGVLMIILLVLFWLLKRGGSTKKVNKKAVYKPSTQDQTYLKNLQQQIQSLENTSPARPAPEIKTPPIVNYPPKKVESQVVTPTPVEPISDFKPIEKTPEPQMKEQEPTPQPEIVLPDQPQQVTPPTQVSPPEVTKDTNSGSSMMDRLKEKGIKTPS